LHVQLEGEWIGKALDYLSQRLGRDALAALVRANSLPLKDERVQLNAALWQVVALKLFLEKDDAGRTLGDAWESEGWPGLNNDERVMARYRRDSRVTVIEVQRHLGPESTLCVDVFEPERAPFVVMDRTLPSRVVRYARLMGWLTHGAHFSRLTVPAFEVPGHIWDAWESRVRTEHASAAAAAPGPSIRQFLSLNFRRGVEWIHELTSEFAARLFENADLNQCLAAYRFTVPEPEVEALLRAKPEFSPAEADESDRFAKPLALFRWLRTGDVAATEPETAEALHFESSVNGVPILANVRLYADRLVLETFSKAKHRQAREWLEDRLSDKLAFEEESFYDLAKRAQDRRREQATINAAQAVLFKDAEAGAETRPVNTEAEAPVPPDPHQLAALRQGHEQACQKLLDAPQSELEGLSPRQAAGEPRLRPRLVDFMKRLIHRQELRNLEEGTNLSLDPMLEALGLSELK
jgi:hypothetical protein